jgi:hypothetical protein
MLEIDPDDPAFLYSSNLWEVATRAGLWSPAEGRKLNWKNDIGYPQQVPHHTYATRRQWRFYSLAKPSAKFNPYPTLESNNLPVSIVPDFKISPQWLFNAQRDYFQGTDFDLSKGPGAGPYGTPERFDWAASYDGSLTFEESGFGYFERPTGMYRTSTGLIATPRKGIPDLLGASFWLCQYNPGSSVFVPLYVGITDLPSPFTTGSLFEYDPKSFFWAGAVLGDHQRYFSMYIRPEVVAEAERLEQASIDKLVDAEAQVINLLTSSSEADAVDFLTQFVWENTKTIHDFWVALFPRMLTRWHDGYIIKTDKPQISVTKLFYPKEWLQLVGWFDALSQERKREAYFDQFENINEVDVPLIPMLSFLNPVENDLSTGESGAQKQYSPTDPLSAAVEGMALPNPSTHFSVGLQVIAILLFGAFFTFVGVLIGIKYSGKIRDGYHNLQNH